MSSTLSNSNPNLFSFFDHNSQCNNFAGQQQPIATSSYENQLSMPIVILDNQVQSKYQLNYEENQAQQLHSSPPQLPNDNNASQIQEQNPSEKESVKSRGKKILRSTMLIMRMFPELFKKTNQQQLNDNHTTQQDHASPVCDNNQIQNEEDQASYNLQDHNQLSDPINQDRFPHDIQQKEVEQIEYKNKNKDQENQVTFRSNQILISDNQEKPSNKDEQQIIKSTHASLSKNVNQKQDGIDKVELQKDVKSWVKPVFDQFIEETLNPKIKEEEKIIEKVVEDHLISLIDQQSRFIESQYVQIQLQTESQIQQSALLASRVSLSHSPKHSYQQPEQTLPSSQQALIASPTNQYYQKQQQFQLPGEQLLDCQRHNDYNSQQIQNFLQQQDSNIPFEKLITFNGNSSCNTLIPSNQSHRSGFQSQNGTPKVSQNVEASNNASSNSRSTNIISTITLPNDPFHQTSSFHNFSNDNQGETHIQQAPLKQSEVILKSEQFPLHSISDSYFGINSSSSSQPSQLNDYNIQKYVKTFIQNIRKSNKKDAIYQSDLQQSSSNNQYQAANDNYNIPYQDTQHTFAYNQNQNNQHENNSLSSKFNNSSPEHQSPLVHSSTSIAKALSYGNQLSTTAFEQIDKPTSPLNQPSQTDAYKLPVTHYSKQQIYGQVQQPIELSSQPNTNEGQFYSGYSFANSLPQKEQEKQIQQFQEYQNIPSSNHFPQKIENQQKQMRYDQVPSYEQQQHSIFSQSLPNERTNYSNGFNQQQQYTDYSQQSPNSYLQFAPNSDYKNNTYGSSADYSSPLHEQYYSSSGNHASNTLKEFTLPQSNELLYNHQEVTPDEKYQYINNQQKPNLNYEGGHELNSFQYQENDTKQQNFQSGGSRQKYPRAVTEVDYENEEEEGQYSSLSLDDHHRYLQIEQQEESPSEIQNEFQLYEQGDKNKHTEVYKKRAQYLEQVDEREEHEGAVSSLSPERNHHLFQQKNGKQGSLNLQIVNKKGECEEEDEEDDDEVAHSQQEDVSQPTKNIKERYKFVDDRKKSVESQDSGIVAFQDIQKHVENKIKEYDQKQQRSNSKQINVQIEGQTKSDDPTNEKNESEEADPSIHINLDHISVSSPQARDLNNKHRLFGNDTPERSTEKQSISQESTPRKKFRLKQQIKESTFKASPTNKISKSSNDLNSPKKLINGSTSPSKNMEMSKSPNSKSAFPMKRLNSCYENLQFKDKSSTPSISKESSPISNQKLVVNRSAKRAATSILSPPHHSQMNFESKLIFKENYMISVSLEIVEETPKNPKQRILEKKKSSVIFNSNQEKSNKNQSETLDLYSKHKEINRSTLEEQKRIGQEKFKDSMNMSSSKMKNSVDKSSSSIKMKQSMDKSSPYVNNKKRNDFNFIAGQNFGISSPLQKSESDMSLATSIDAQRYKEKQRKELLQVELQVQKEKESLNQLLQQEKQQKSTSGIKTPQSELNNHISTYTNNESNDSINKSNNKSINQQNKSQNLQNQQIKECNSPSSNKNDKFNQFISRNQEWASEKEKKIKQEQNFKDKTSTKDCTFKPAINSSLKRSMTFSNASNVQSPKSLHTNGSKLQEEFNKIKSPTSLQLKATKDFRKCKTKDFDADGSNGDFNFPSRQKSTHLITKNNGDSVYNQNHISRDTNDGGLKQDIEDVLSILQNIGMQN